VPESCAAIAVAAKCKIRGKGPSLSRLISRLDLPLSMLGIRRVSRLAAEPRSAHRSVQLGPSPRVRTLSGVSGGMGIPESLGAMLIGDDESRTGPSILMLASVTFSGGIRKLGSCVGVSLEGRCGGIGTFGSVAGMACVAGSYASNGDEIDRRTRDKREPSRSDQNLDGECLDNAEGVLVERLSRSGAIAKPEGGRDASGLSGNGREIGASSLRCLVLEAVDDLGASDPNHDSRRFRWPSASSIAFGG